MAIKNKYSDIDLSKYEKGYQASQTVQQAQKLKEQAESAVKKYGDFQYANQDAYKSAMDAILNRKAFFYDLNGDALYQQYKDQYMQQGKLAMQDTMGQAAAMTGGYGNSYAASVGNQAYQGYLSQLNNLVPELYNLALSAYNTEGDRLKGNFDLLSIDRNAERAEWMDKYNMLVNDRGYYSDNYNQVYTQDYNKFNDNRTYDTNQYWSEYNAGYQIDRDAIADAQWQKEYDLAVKNSNKTLGGGGGSGKSITQDILDAALDNYSDQDSLNTYLNGLLLQGYTTEQCASIKDWVVSQKKKGYVNQNYGVTKSGKSRDEYDVGVRGGNKK